MNDLSRALERAIAEIEEHNAEYHHKTPEALIDEWKALVRKADVSFARDYPGRDHVLYTGIGSPAE